jgi:hypothetical protein
MKSDNVKLYNPKRMERQYNIAVNLIFVSGLMFICLLGSALIFREYDKYSGNAQRRVEKRALWFLDALKISYDVVACDASDSDNDGYITCSYNSNGKVETIECSDSIFLNSTCRNMKMLSPKNK